jgi:hypothetical protein
MGGGIGGVFGGYGRERRVLLAMLGVWLIDCRAWEGCASRRNLMGNRLLGFKITVACCFRDELVEDGCREIDWETRP